MLLGVRVVDSGVEDGPLLAGCGAFEVPVSHNMRARVPVLDRVMSWEEASLHAEVNTEERVWLVFSPAVGHFTTNKVLNTAIGSNRASEGIHLAKEMGVLPSHALAHGAKIV